MRTRSGPAPRGGFTLVELLVVIAIIAVLVGMLLVAVQKVRDTGNRTTAVSEMNQLDAAATTFNQRYGFYPPTHMVEADTTGVTRVRRFMIPTRFDQPEVQYLRKMFPRWNPQPGAGLAPDNVTFSPPLQGAGKELNANQCYVYFIGGPGTLLGPNDPTWPGLRPGWDKSAPQAPTGNSKDGPFYEAFQDARLTNKSVSPATYDGQYRDPYDTPYAFFNISTSPSLDLQTAKVPFPWPTGLTTATFPRNGGQFGGAATTETHEYAPDTYDPTTDTGANLTAHPLASSVVQKPIPPTDNGAVVIKWVNAGRFQIVTAGRDQKFGPGTYNPTGYPPSPTLPYSTVLTPAQLPQVWTPGSGKYLQGQVGEDDLGNFNNGLQLANPGS